MVAVVWVIVRIARAFAATLTLVTSRRVMTGLPWRYIRSLPRSRPWIGAATMCLVAGAAAVPAAALLPHSDAVAAYNAGLAALAVGIGVSWVRALTQWYSLRRR